jgi:Kef-type K+ transport system membrane component KefB
LAKLYRLLRRNRAHILGRRRGRCAAFRREWRASLSIGLVSFLAPFAVVALLCFYALDWTRRQAEIGGVALSTTSLAVVYAVLVETGLNRELVGKRLMSATFVTDIATVAGLTALFIKPSLWIVPFTLVSVALIVVLPKLSPWFFSRYGDRVIEREIKLVFACLFLLTYLGTRANSQAALHAFVLGLVMSTHYVRHRQEQDRMRVVAFAFLTPFFFLKGGMSVSASTLWGNLGILALLFVGKMVPKLTGVFPLARRYTSPHAIFTTLLMSTGLTFGTITSLYGLSAHIIDRTQFSLLIASSFSQRSCRPRSRSASTRQPRMSNETSPLPSPRLASGVPSKKLKPDLGKSRVREHPYA